MRRSVIIIALNKHKYRRLRKYLFYRNKWKFLSNHLFFFSDRITPWSSYPSQYLASPPAPPPYSQPIPPLLPAPAPYPYLAPAPSYSQPAPAPSYSQPSSPEPSYSQPAPPAPTYYQHGGDYGNEDASDLRNRDPPGTLYSQYVAAAPFQNSKESPLLNQFREESEKNRQKYTSPSYSNKYQTIDA